MKAPTYAEAVSEIAQAQAAGWSGWKLRADSSLAIALMMDGYDVHYGQECMEIIWC